MHGQVDVSSCTAASSSSPKSPLAAEAMVTLDDSPLRICGADSARPSKYLQPKRVTNSPSRCRLLLCLVRRSAGFSSPSTLRKSTRPVRTACWIQRVCASKWRNLLSPCLLQIPIAALESVQTRSGTTTPRSFGRAW